MELKGIGASRGIAIGKAYRYVQQMPRFEREREGDVQTELSRLDAAFSKVSQQIMDTRVRVEETLGQAHAAIFDAHHEMLMDPAMREGTVEKIEAGASAPYAYQETADGFVTLFESMDDSYMRERAADIKDVSAQVIYALCGIEQKDLSAISEPVILVAEDLTPSDTAKLNKALVRGFVTQIGGRTSHSAIMARSLEIPAVLGLSDILDHVADGMPLIMDGDAGTVILDPDAEVLERYLRLEQEEARVRTRQKKFVTEPSRTADGHHFEIAGNIGSPKDLEAVINSGGEGIGLYRTEFLYMDQPDFPDEETQYHAYKTVLEHMAPRPVVIRTLDIGGDKKLPYLPLEAELNPFLGHRAIRLCLDRLDIFKTQLRALLRASVHGNLKIMFPMIATLEEFQLARAQVDEVRAALASEGIQTSDTLEVGIMVEIPSAAIMAPQFAKYVDFFSIGTNDLIQYTFAADRMNEKVSYLYQPYHPALLRLISGVITAAHAEGKWAGMCGEMAGDTVALPLLLGLGLDEFSMSASGILPARELAAQVNRRDARTLVERALEMTSHAEVERLVREYLDAL